MFWKNCLIKIYSKILNNLKTDFVYNQRPYSQIRIPQYFLLQQQKKRNLGILFTESEQYVSIQRFKKQRKLPLNLSNGQRVVRPEMIGLYSVGGSEWWRVVRTVVVVKWNRTSHIVASSIC